MPAVRPVNMNCRVKSAFASTACHAVRVDSMMTVELGITITGEYKTRTSPAIPGAA
jgi:hypothetical protein